MAVLLETRDRNVVPRWRDFATTVRLGELSSPIVPRTNVPKFNLGEVLSTWDASPGLAVAGDLMGAAIVAGVPEIARRAAEFVIEQELPDTSSLRRMAARMLGEKLEISLIAPNEPIVISSESVRRPSPTIARIRSELGTRPANAVLWIDLAYMYAIRGLSKKAERAILIALNLAPSNRFVLRSAARFYVHEGRLDEAHRLIRTAPGAIHDPWLLAAEIAIAMAADHSSFFAKAGLSMATNENHSNHQLSELNSALGTLEFHNGNNRKAKKHLRTSLLDPNDNSLAQATWLSENVNGFTLAIPESDFRIERPFEANTYRAYSASKWEEAFQSSIEWMGDQPFSGRAARSAAFIASNIFEDFELAAKIASFGLIANPDDPGFKITLAYSFAKRDLTDEASIELKKVTSVEAEDWLPVAIDANYGLIAYRRGEIEGARTFYLSATTKAEALADMRIAVMALTNWALEEAQISLEKAFSLLEKAQTLSKKAIGPDVPFVLDRTLKRLIEKKGEIGG